MDPKVGRNAEQFSCWPSTDECLATATTASQEDGSGTILTEAPQETSPDSQQSDEIPASSALSVDGGPQASGMQAVNPNSFQPDPTSTTSTTMTDPGSTTTMNTSVSATISPVPNAAPSTSTSVTTADPSLATVGTVEAAENGHNTDRLSAGAMTGVAMGTFILGAILAFVAAFFLFKQRHKHKIANVSRREYPSYADSAPDLAMMQSKRAGSLVGRYSPYAQVSQIPIPALLTAPSSSPIPAPASIPAKASQNVTAFLPPAADSEEVWNQVSHLFALMHEHIERYYRDVNAIITPSMESDIAKFGAKGVDMAELLQECSSSTAALKHALVAYVLVVTGPKQRDDDEGTLFPEELYTAHAGKHTSVDSDPDLVAATSLHRRISVYLYSSITGMPNRRGSGMAQSNMRKAAEHFSLTFFPWANPTSSDQDKDEDLARIITEALTMRIWLFGQLDTYDFEWEGVGERGIVINPGLVRRKRAEGDGGDLVVQLVEGAVVAM